MALLTDRWRKLKGSFRAHPRRYITGLVVALLAYPVLGTLALWTGFVEWVIRSEDVSVEIDNPAYTIWPGRIHLKEVRIAVNGETQFILRGNGFFADISVIELFSHRVHVTELVAREVKYHMRVQVKDLDEASERLKAYPPLHGLPGQNTVSVKVAEKTEEVDQSWTVIVDGLDISVADLWFFEYRYVGPGKLKGGFTVGPGVMEVASSVQDIGPGELRFGEKDVIARNFQGQITCDIPRVNPEEHADASFVELVSARVNLRADMTSLKNVGAYFDLFDISKGAGPLAFDLYMIKGYLGPKSKLSFQTDAVRLKGDGIGIETDWKLSFDASGGEGGLPLGQSDFKSTYVSFARKNQQLTIQSHGHHAEAVLDTIRLGGATNLKRANLRMPNIVSNDLDDLGVLLPEDSALRVAAGEAKASLNLNMDGKYWVTGPLKAEILRTKLSAAGVAVEGNTWVSAQARFNPKLETNMVEDVLVRLRNTSMRTGDEAVTGWWMDLSSKRISMWGGNNPRAEGSISMHAKDLEPALEALAEKDVISDIIPWLTSLRDLRAKTTFRVQGKTTDVSLESESQIWDVSGRVFTNAKQSLMALVIGGQAVSVGIADLGDGLQIRPFAKTDWLNSRLAQFPKPLVQMKPDKP